MTIILLAFTWPPERMINAAYGPGLNVGKLFATVKELL